MGLDGEVEAVTLPQVCETVGRLGRFDQTAGGLERAVVGEHPRVHGGVVAGFLLGPPVDVGHRFAECPQLGSLLPHAVASGGSGQVR